MLIIILPIIFIMKSPLGLQSPKPHVVQSTSSTSHTNKSRPAASNVSSSPQLQHVPTSKLNSRALSDVTTPRSSASTVSLSPQLQRDPTFKFNSRTSNVMRQQEPHLKGAQSTSSGKTTASVHTKTTNPNKSSMAYM